MLQFVADVTHRARPGTGSVIDHAIPPQEVETVLAECVEATGKIDEMRRETTLARRNVQPETAPAPLGVASGTESSTCSPSKRTSGLGINGRHELHFLPKFAKHLGGQHVTAVARAALDSHVRIAQLHLRHVSPNQQFDTGKPSNSDIMATGRSKRGWCVAVIAAEPLASLTLARAPCRHTDWPHDLSAYGQGENNGGAVRQPFPDVCMCLSMVWYLQDTDSESGGTWCAVAGLHFIISFTAA